MQMESTLKSRVEVFKDAEELLEWATALNIHRDPAVLERLEVLRRETGKSRLFLMFSES